MNMKKRLTAALLAVVMILSLAACAAQEEQTVQEAPVDAGVAVHTVTIGTDTIATENKTVGKLSAEEEATIMVGSSAKCTAVYKNAGDTVEAGEKIAALDFGATIANYAAARIGKKYGIPVLVTEHAYSPWAKPEGKEFSRFVAQNAKVTCESGNCTITDGTVTETCTDCIAK